MKSGEKKDNKYESCTVQPFIFRSRSITTCFTSNTYRGIEHTPRTFQTKPETVTRRLGSRRDDACRPKTSGDDALLLRQPLQVLKQLLFYPLTVIWQESMK